MNTPFWRVRGENQAGFVASQGGAPATEATVGPSDKLEAGRPMRMVSEWFRHEETKAKSDWGVWEWEGMPGKTAKESEARV